MSIFDELKKRYSQRINEAKSAINFVKQQPSNFKVGMNVARNPNQSVATRTAQGFLQGTGKFLADTGSFANKIQSSRVANVLNPATLIIRRNQPRMQNEINQFKVNLEKVKPLTTAGKVGSFVGENLPAVALPASKGYTATKIASPAVRMAANSLLRGGENAAIQGAYRYARGEKITPKNVASDVGTGALFNAALSLKSTAKGVGEMIDNARQINRGYRINNYNKYAGKMAGSARLPQNTDNLTPLGNKIKEPQTNLKLSQSTLSQGSEGIRKPISLSKPSEKFSFVSELKRKLVDSASPIEDTLSSAEKAGFKVAPKNDVRLQIDKVLRSDSLATQFIKDNNLEKVIRSADNLDEFNQYLISKQAGDVAKKGIRTGRNIAQDEQFINSVAQKYEPLAQEVYGYNRKLLDYLTDSGMISKELNTTLKKEYPNYVPLNRVFSEIEQKAMGFGGKSKGVASQGTQNVVKKLQGSEREIENPIESIISKTSQAFQDAEKNRAAQMLTSYKDIPGNPFGLTEIKGAKSAGASTISVFENGVKKIYQADPIIAEAAKNLNQQQIGMLGQIFAVPTRILKMGATGLNLPFVASNLVKDQVFATINSSRALKTSLANPVNFGKAFFSVLKQDKLYDDWVRSGASFTSYDIARNQIKPTVAKIRAGKNVGTKIAYSVTHPQELLRTLENVIGKSEELTRVQQFNGMKNQLIKEGRSVEDATLLASKASRENTANFARRGEWGNWLNVMIPYLNAGIQGTRSLMRSATTRPIQTAAKLSTLVFLPTAYATVWNTSDPKRKEAYDDIQEYEKEGNIVIIPPNPVKDENGRWNAIKIPMTPGMANLASIVRRQVEGVAGIDNQSIGKIASDLFAAGTSFELSGRKLLSQITPQGLKPAIEGATNTNLFTGNKIVPEYMKDFPTELQARENTSGTARLIGKIAKTSPLKVENAIRTSFGGVGQQALNASDKGLNKLGVIPKEQIGGKDIAESISNRFTSATGGKQLNDLYDNKSKSSNKNGLIEKDGKYYFKIGGSVKTADTPEEAQKAIAKDEFKKSGANFKDMGKYVLRKKEDGEPQEMPKGEYMFKINNAKLDRAKKSKNLKEWNKLAQKKLGYLTYKLNDQSVDELDKLEFQKQIDALNIEMIKYGAYKGFTKPKKAKKAKQLKLATSAVRPPSLPSLRSSVSSVNIPKLSISKIGGGSVQTGRPRSLRTKRYAT